MNIIELTKIKLHLTILKRSLINSVYYILIMCSRLFLGSLSLFLLLLFTNVDVTAQNKILQGVIRDRQSDEHIPFVSIISKNNGSGSLTDSAGNFSIAIRDYPPDTLLITSVGYKPVAFIVPQRFDSTFITIQMDIAPVGKEAIVKVKFNRALWFWNRIQKNKYKHDRSDLQSFSYEVYNKLELDLVNINKEKLSNSKLLKPFNVIFDFVDTSEDKPYLPVFLTETISDYYFQRTPRKVKEIIKASKTNGVDNESITKLLGATYQNVNVYNNTIPVFDKQFISPLHDKGDNYYTFKLLDTQYINNKRLVHLSFKPKRKGENTFDGDCWIHDTTYAVQKITLRPSVSANLNFVKDLTLIQEFKLLDDTTWFLAKDKFVADIALLGNSKGNFKGRKTTTYRNILLNSDSIQNVVANNKKAEEVTVLPSSELKEDDYWTVNRHESLNANEQGVYKMIDTIQNLPAFKKYYNSLYFLTTGLKYIGNYEIGPWYNWISANSWEGTRLRFDLGTNYKFSKQYYLHGYMAYGFKDQALKGKADIFYLPSKHPRFYLYAAYTKDLDNGQQYYDEISTDNIFSLAIRKEGVPVKFQRIEEKRLEVFKEINSGFSFLFSAVSKQYEPLRNLPDKSFFENNIPGEALNNFETSVKIKYAYLEKFLESTFLRSSLGSDYPIAELKYSKGWANVLQSSYNYHKVNFTVHDYINLPPFGNLYYNFFGGKVFGTLPFQLLEVHPGNEIYYYNKYAFNMMNRFEFISDRYAGFNIEHNVGSGLFKYVPLTRKLKFRQFWSVKGVTGSLSDANKNLNFVGTNQFQSLDGKTYVEVGTGVDNIFKVLRFDFVWRVLPQPLPKDQNRRFGIFGSFRLAF